MRLRSRAAFFGDVERRRKARARRRAGDDAKVKRLLKAKVDANSRNKNEKALTASRRFRGPAPMATWAIQLLRYGI